jgi:hypothetical protein
METVRLLWKAPAKERSTSLWSEVADGVDYWFVYGPSLDRVTAGYRRLTGEAPMMPRWAFGLWQSRQRYETQQQSLDVVDGFARAGSPSTTSCRTGSTGRRARGDRTASTPRASPIPTAGSAPSTSGTRGS